VRCRDRSANAIRFVYFASRICGYRTSYGKQRLLRVSDAIEDHGREARMSAACLTTHWDSLLGRKAPRTGPRRLQVSLPETMPCRSSQQNM